MNKQQKAILTLQVIIEAIKNLVRMVSRRLKRNGSDLSGRKKRRKEHVKHDDPRKGS